MAMNVEDRILEIVSTLARLEQKLDAHIEVEDDWRSRMEQALESAAAKRSAWVKAGLTGIASSGLVVWIAQQIWPRR